MSYGTAKLLVLAANYLCVLGLLFLLLHLLGLGGFLRPQTASREQSGGVGRREWLALFFTVYLFLFQPIVQTLMAGQINLYVIVLLCLMWYALKRNASPVLSALPLALAVVLKTYPLLFLPILLLKGRWQTAFWTLGFLDTRLPRPACRCELSCPAARLVAGLADACGPLRGIH
jgi:hypothetical protein